MINQWKDEIINGFKLSAQIMANMNKKVRNKYGADFLAAQQAVDIHGQHMHNAIEQKNSNGS